MPIVKVARSARTHLVAAMRVMKELTNILGLFTKEADRGWRRRRSRRTCLIKPFICLIDLRKEARERKDYQTGDAIRDRLGELGVALLDKKEGTTWELKLMSSGAAERTGPPEAGPPEAGPPEAGPPEQSIRSDLILASTRA